MKNPNFLSRINALTRLCGKSPLLLMCLLLGTSNLASAKGNGDPGKPKMAPDHLIVKFKEGVATTVSPTGDAIAVGNKDIDKLLHDYHCVSASKLNAGKNSAHNGTTYVLKFAGAVPVERLIGSFKETGLIKYAEPDYMASWESTTPNDPYFVYSWGLFNNGSFTYSTPVVTGADMNMKLAWDITQGSSAVTVAVIDAGVKLDHPEFAGRIWQNTGEIAGNGIDDDGNGYVDDFQGWNFVSSTNDPTDDHSHGTNVTGIIGATGNNGIGYAGMDWNCKLMILKTQDNTGEGAYSDMILAINYASEKGAKVINMSVGGYASSVALQDAVNDAYANNVTIVAAMGNDNISTPLYPAACTHVVAVGATTAADTRASFSNFGSHICVAAPGNVIFGLWYLSNTDYTHGMSGTSMASPHVAGLVSLLLAQDPTRTPDQIRTILETTSEDQVGDPGEDVAGFDNYFGYGRVNAYSALTACSAPVVGAISGAASVCAGSTAAYTDTTVSGVWSSSNLSVATIGTTGVLAAISEGITVVTYTKTTVCGTSFATKVVTVNPSSAGTISGGSSVATGSSMTLSSTVAGGAWSSTNTGVATINSTTGELSGITAGTTTISYALTNSCGSFSASMVVSVSTPTVSKIISIVTISSPRIVEADNSGNLIYCGGSMNQVLKLDTFGTITAIAGNGTHGFSGDGGPATNAQFAGIAGLVYDAAGNLYVSDYENHRVRRIDPSGIVTTIAGNGSTGLSGDGGPATAAEIAPQGLTIDQASGHLYILSGPNVRMIDLTTGIITTVAGNGSHGFSGDGGPATAAQLGLGYIYFHSNGNLYISDNYRIRKVNPAGIISTICGDGFSEFSGDGGPATAAQLVTPSGMTEDSDGNLYVADGYAHRVRKISTDGIITTVAGTGSSFYYGDCGAPLSAGIGYPEDLAFDAHNNLIIAELLNSRIRKIYSFDTATITGPNTMCVGDVIDYSSTSAGGFWGSTNELVATINSATGVLTALSAGTCQIGYTHSMESAAACNVLITITVNGTPSIIGGATSIALGATTTMTCTPPGGTWSSTNTGVAIINATSGVLTALSIGTTTVSYVLSNSCGTFGTSIVVSVAATASATTKRVTTLMMSSFPALIREIVVDKNDNIIFWKDDTYKIYKRDPSGAITVIAGNGSYGYSGDGGPATDASIKGPQGLVFDDAGNLYFADFSARVIRRIDTAGIITTIAGDGTNASTGDGGPATAAGLNSAFSIGYDPAGYIVFGEFQRIRRIDLGTGIISTIAGTGTAGYSGDGGPATAAKINHPWGLYCHTDGTIYFSDVEYNCVRKITPSGIISTVAGTGTHGSSGDGGPATNARLYAPVGITMDKGGNLIIADAVNRKIRSVNPAGIIETIVGSGIDGYNGDCRIPLTAELQYPSHVALDTNGNLLISDPNSTRVRKVSSSSFGIITGSNLLCTGDVSTYSTSLTGGTWTTSNAAVATINASTGSLTAVGSGTCQVQYVNLAACDAGLDITVTGMPTAITGVVSIEPGETSTLSSSPGGGTWSSANTAVATINAVTGAITGMSLGSTVVSYTAISICGTFTTTANVFVETMPAPGSITTVAGTGVAGFWGDGGPAAAAAISHPSNITHDNSGNIVFIDYLNYRVRKIDGSGNITTIAGNGSTDFSGDGGPATDAGVNRMTGLLYDAAGNLYISCSSQNRVRKVNTSGIITTIAGTGGSISGGDFGQATAAQIGGPAGLAIDASGNLFVAEQYRGKIRKIDLTTGIITTIAGTGIEGYSGDGGPATAAKLHGPSYMSFHSDGSLYFTDNTNHCIRKINASGIISTVAGNGTDGFSGDGGIATDAKLTYPGGFVFDGAGNMYIADKGNYKVRKVNTLGIIETIAGTSDYLFNGDCRSPLTANLFNPIDVLLDTSNHLWILDIDNNRIRIITDLISAPISGSNILCVGSTATYTTSVTGGTWSTSNSAIATIDAVTGIATGLTNGTCNILHVSPTTCDIYMTITVQGGPNAAITGTATVEEEAYTTLYCATLGGTWSSTNTSVATINPTTGLLKGLSTGTTIVTYTVTNSCGSISSSRIVTVTAPVSIVDYIETIAGNGTAGYSGDGGPATGATINQPTFMVLDNAGNIVFCDRSNDVIRKIDGDGNITTIAGNGTASFSGDEGPATDAALNNVTGLVYDSEGNLYVSDAGNGRLRKINTSGIITTISGHGGGGSDESEIPAIDARLYSPSGLATDNAGNLYVCDFGGCRVHKINLSTGIITRVAGNYISGGYSGDGGPASVANLKNPNGIFYHPDGSLYICDRTNGCVRKVSPSGIITTVVGTGVTGFFGDGGPASAAKLSSPRGLTMDESGNMYIADFGNNRVRKVDASGLISTVVGTGGTVYNGDCRSPLTANVNQPYAIQLDGSNHLLISDYANNRLRRITSNSIIYGTTSFCAGITSTYTIGATGGTWSTSNSAVATIDAATGVATGLTAGTCNIIYVSPSSCGDQLTITVNAAPALPAISGALLVLQGNSTTLYCGPSGGTWSSTNTSVASINAATGVLSGLTTGTTTVSYTATNSCGTSTTTINVTITESIVAPSLSGNISTIAGNGTAGFSGDGGPAAAATISTPNSVITDNAGNIYFTDLSNGRVRKIDATGIITTLAGNGTTGYSGDSGPATNASFSNVAGLALDAAGNLYITDLNNNRVRKVSPLGIVTTYAGTGTATSGGDGGQASATAIYKPYGITIDPAGYMYVVEQYGNKVRKIDMATGIITNVAGTGSLGYSGDGGAATAAKLRNPNCIYYRPDGTLYLSDNGNQRIRKISTSGIITTIAGNGVAGYSGDGGAATAAQLRFPAGLKVDIAGNIYVADFENFVVRKISTSGIISTIAGTGIGEYNGDCRVPTTAGINKASDIAFDGSNNLIIADILNNRLRKISDLPNTSVFGSTELCVGSTATYTTTETDGTWSTSNSSVATINAATGVATALTAGTCNIIYVTPTSCIAELTITVNGAPTLSAITGTLSVSQGSITTLSCTPSGGTWTSDNTPVAIINATSGLLTSLSVGTAGISYTVINGCGSFNASVIVTVNCGLSGPGMISTVLGTGTAGNGGSGEPGTSTAIYGPMGIAADATGNIYVADHNNHKVRKVTPAGISTDFAGNGTYGYSGDGGPATAAKITAATGVAIYGNDVYFVDLDSYTIRKVDAAGIITTVVGDGTAGFVGDGGPATLAKIRLVYSLCFDNSGNLYFADKFNYRIRKVTPSGVISTIAGIGTIGSTGDGGPATLARLMSPHHITTDTAGNIYISDELKHNVRKIDATTGIISVFVGIGVSGYTGDGGPASAASLKRPGGIYFDADGNFFICDELNHVIRKVSATTGFMSTYAGTGVSGDGGDGGSPSAATFNRPVDATLDAFGNMYISDFSNNRVRKITNHAGAIEGPGLVCLGSNIILTIGATGGTWSSSNVAVATVEPSTGIVTGISSGTTVISYTVGSCPLTHIVTVSPASYSVSGASSLCVGSTTTLSTTGSGGTWSSSNVAVATVGSSTGIVTGISSGTTVISYTVGSCSSTHIVTVSPESYSISGASSLCAGSTTTLSTTGSGGTWSSSNVAVATVGSSTGIVTGISSGTTVISYTVGSCSSTHIVTVSPGSYSVSGAPSLCVGSTTTLSTTGSGGAWSCSNVAVATVGAASGIVTGLSDGVATISYGVGPCIASLTITVNSAPTVSAITGTTTIAMGVTSTLSSSPSGGIWSSTNTSIASINTASGSLTGLTAGTVTVSYAITNSCGTAAATTNVTVTDTATGPALYGNITTIAGNGTEGFAGDGGPSTGSIISGPGAMAKDNAGNIYFCDYGNRRVRKIDVSGAITTVVGGGAVEGFDAEGGMATNAKFYGISGLAVDAAGNLYFSDNAESNVYKVDGTGILTRYAGVGLTESGEDGGQATDTKIWNPYGIAIDPAGYMYIAEQLGSKIRKIDMSTGIITTIAGNGTMSYSGDGGAATAATLSYPNFVYFHTDGNLYVTDNGNHRIRKISTSGIITTVVGSGVGGFSGDGGPATAAKLLYPGGFKIDNSGNFFISDYENYRVRMVTTDGNIHSVAGTGVGVFNGDCQNPLTANLNKPIDLVIDADNNLVIADYLNNRLRKLTNLPSSSVSVSGSTDICVGSIAAYTATATGGTWSTSNAAVATINAATGVATALSAGICNILYLSPTTCDGQLTITVNSTPTLSAITGALSVAQGSFSALSCTPSGGIWSSANTTVATINAASGVWNGLSLGTTTISYIYTNSCGSDGAAVEVNVTEPVVSTDYIVTIAGNGTPGFSGESGQATAASLNNPTAITLDNSGNIVFSDHVNSRIRKIDASGNITTIAGSGSTTFSGDGGQATAAGLDAVNGLLYDADGNLYISDSRHNRVRKINNSGIITTIAGTGASSSGGDGGQATAAQLYGTFGLAMDPTGNLYVAEVFGHRIRKINLGTGIITTIAGTGSAGYSGNDGPATAAQVKNPNYIFYHTDGSLYFSDNGNHRIRKVNPAGIITSVVGTGVAGFTGDDGPATAARLNFPGGFRIDEAGNMYIADYSNNRVRKVDASGVINTIAGTGTTAYNGDCQSPLTANLSLPVDVQFDASNHLLISDFENNRIRKITQLGIVSGSTSMCVGGTGTYTTSATGGTWSTSNAAVATVNSVTGIATALSAGTCSIQYITGASCNANLAITVNGGASSIGGTLSVCEGGTTTLTGSPLGGTWSSGTPAIASIDASTGIVSAVTAGTTAISYVVSGSCPSVTVVTVGAATANTGTATLCLSQPARAYLLSNAVEGGTWSSSNVAVATINMLTGAMSGIALGTANISYHQPGGCVSISVATVNAAVPSITGATGVCPGGQATVLNAADAGTWSSSDPAKAEIDAGTGVITGHVSGSAIVTYMTSPGCYTTSTVYIHNLPGAITGNASVCQGLTSTLSCVPAGGTWSSGSPTVCTINSTYAIASALSAGTANITYTVGSTGCQSTRVFSVNALPGAVTGTASACVGATTTLNCTPSGGTWSSSNTTRASVDLTSGIVTGNTPGTGTITYTATGGCYITKSVTILPTPATLAGPSGVCIGTYVVLTTSPAGGTWTSTNTAAASVNTGIIYGLTTGTTTISYVVANGCFQTKEITVNNAPGSITGTQTMCAGNTEALACSPAGGNWSSSSTTIATVNAATGDVTGLTAGTAVITYSIGTCYQTTIVTINGLPGALTGTQTICEGTTTTFSGTPDGGVWSSSNDAIASVSAGIVRGNSPGVATIQYEVGAGCSVTRNVTVSAAPGSISGATSLCTGSSTTLSAAPGGGVWSSSLVANATVNAATGDVAGIAAGTSEITYSIGTCYQTTVVTIIEIPDALTGVQTVCNGSTTSFGSTTVGGVWSSSNDAIASVNAGIVTGISPGEATIQYTVGGGCSVTRTVTVIAAPGAITGSTSFCIGSVSTLLAAPGGGVWSSSNAARASVDAGTGEVTAITSGTATITYTMGSCFSTTEITVGSSSATIYGTPTVCEGLTTTLIGSPVGGTWSSMNTAIASVNAGVVRGVSGGVATLVYVPASGCSVTVDFTVIGRPTAITGSPSVCIGATTSLNSTPAGGVWTSNVPGRASIDPASGLVTGIVAGTSRITYDISGCKTGIQITVNSSPSAITGTTFICADNSTNLSATPAGGTWLSGTPTVATVSATGTVTGLLAGTTEIEYTAGTGCSRTTIVTVNAGLPANVGTPVICLGQPLTVELLTNPVGGGTWATSNHTKLVTSTSGQMRGMSVGTVNVTYKVSTGCYSVSEVTVNPAVAPITGTTNVCPGDTVTVSNVDGGGTWSSSVVSRATIDEITGSLAGISSGVSYITYKITEGCYKTRPQTVLTAPGPISGATSVVNGSTINMTCSPPYGLWSAVNAAVASVNAYSGIVRGNSVGVGRIVYTTSNGCTSSIDITVLSSKPGASSVSEADVIFNLYPNPSSGSINIISSEMGVLSVLSIDGKTIQNYVIDKSSTTIQLPYDLAAGVYMFRFEGTDGSSKMGKMVYHP